MRVFLLMASLISGGVHAEIYKCVDDGRVTYSNVQSKGCTRLNVGPVNTYPAGKSSARNNPTPGDFPKVDPGMQRSRDDERRRILDQELSSEEKALAASRQALADEEAEIVRQRNISGFKAVPLPEANKRLQSYRDQAALHERNIEALRREIGQLR